MLEKAHTGAGEPLWIPTPHPELVEGRRCSGVGEQPAERHSCNHPKRLWSVIPEFAHASIRDPDPPKKLGPGSLAAPGMTRTDLFISDVPETPAEAGVHVAMLEKAHHSADEPLWIPACAGIFGYGVASPKPPYTPAFAGM